MMIVPIVCICILFVWIIGSLRLKLRKCGVEEEEDISKRNEDTNNTNGKKKK